MFMGGGSQRALGVKKEITPGSCGILVEVMEPDPRQPRGEYDTWREGDAEPCCETSSKGGGSAKPGVLDWNKLEQDRGMRYL